MQVAGRTHRGCLQQQEPCDREWFAAVEDWAAFFGAESETGSEGPSGQGSTRGSSSSSATGQSGGGEPEVTLPPFHLYRRALPSYRFPPPYTTYDVTMPYDDHREMVDPTWVAHPGVEA